MLLLILGFSLIALVAGFCLGYVARDTGLM